MVNLKLATPGIPPTIPPSWLHVGKLPHSLVLYQFADGVDELPPNSLVNPTESSGQWTRLVPRSRLFVSATVLLNEGPVSLALVSHVSWDRR